MSSALRRPTRSPSFERGTVVTLSAISRLASRSWLLASGSMASLNSGASVAAVVVGQTVIESVASPRSSCTMTADLGVPT
jgi:hypothetical protein